MPKRRKSKPARVGDRVYIRTGNSTEEGLVREIRGQYAVVSVERDGLQTDYTRRLTLVTPIKEAK